VKPGVGIREGTVGDMWNAKKEARLPGGGLKLTLWISLPELIQSCMRLIWGR